MQFVYRQVVLAISIMAAFVVCTYGMYRCVKKQFLRHRNGATLTVRYDNSLQQNRGDLDVSVYREEVNNPIQLQREEATSDYPDVPMNRERDHKDTVELELSPLGALEKKDHFHRDHGDERNVDPGDELTSADVSPYDGAIKSQIVPTDDDSEDEEIIVL